jgi:zinc protease
VTWHSPALAAAGDAELDLAADVLANGRTSRLYRRLIFDERVASDVTAAQGSRELGGTFQVVATAAPGRTLDELHRAIVEEVERLGAGGPDDAELERGRAQAEAAFVYRLQSLGGFGGKADQLNAYNTYFGDPDGFERDLARYLDATAETIRTATAASLDPAAAVALSVVPLGQEALALPGSVPAPAGL